ncbi:MAG: sodium:solute symporter [Candidatus Neomarinimicrobiota bacterium]|jgi:SSS family transporter|nr:sodium:solute symporter [Candidatus Neomarinimicrobiota bacterium]
MSSIDLIIIVLFLIFSAGLGIYLGKYNKTTSDYFLGGRNLSWPMVMLSIVATETSVLTFVSIPGLAYREDWRFLSLALGFILGRVLVSVFLLGDYMQIGVTSIYEFLGKRFGYLVQRIASGIFLITRVLADGIRFLATAVIIQAVTGWSLSMSLLIIGTTTTIYTIFGGLRSVVWVDSFQFGLYLLGGVIVVGTCLSHIGGQYFTIFSSLINEGKTQIFHFTEITDSWMIGNAVIGGMFLSVASHGTDHMMVQRVLGTGNLKTARKALIGSGFLVFFQFLLFLLAGSLMYLFMDGASIEKDREFAFFITNHLPVGARGIIIAGVLAAAMSTLSSSINALSSSTIMDWMKKKGSLMLARWISGFWAVILISVAMIIDESDEAIVMVGLQIASVTYGALLGLFILAKFDRQFHQISIIIGLIAGIGTALMIKFNGLPWVWMIPLSSAVVVYTTFVINLFINREKN